MLDNTSEDLTDTLIIKTNVTSQDEDVKLNVVTSLDDEVKIFDDRRIKLNIGGIKFETNLSVLIQYPTSMLGCMFSGTYLLKPDNDNYYFVDRDGNLFSYILNYLRTHKMPNLKKIDGLKDEFKYFGLYNKTKQSYKINSIFHGFYNYYKNKIPICINFEIGEKETIKIAGNATLRTTTERLPIPIRIMCLLQAWNPYNNTAIFDKHDLGTIDDIEKMYMRASKVKEYVDTHCVVKTIMFDKIVLKIRYEHINEISDITNVKYEKMGVPALLFLYNGFNYTMHSKCIIEGIRESEQLEHPQETIIISIKNIYYYCFLSGASYIDVNSLDYTKKIAKD